MSEYSGPNAQKPRNWWPVVIFAAIVAACLAGAGSAWGFRDHLDLQNAQTAIAQVTAQAESEATAQAEATEEETEEPHTSVDTSDASGISDDRLNAATQQTPLPPIQIGGSYFNEDELVTVEAGSVSRTSGQKAICKFPASEEMPCWVKYDDDTVKVDIELDFSPFNGILSGTDDENWSVWQVQPSPSLFVFEESRIQSWDEFVSEALWPMEFPEVFWGCWESQAENCRALDDNHTGIIEFDDFMNIYRDCIDPNLCIERATVLMRTMKLDEESCEGDVEQCAEAIDDYIVINNYQTLADWQSLLFGDCFLKFSNPQATNELNDCSMMDFDGSGRVDLMDLYYNNGDIKVWNTEGRAIVLHGHRLDRGNAMIVIETPGLFEIDMLMSESTTIHFVDTLINDWREMMRSDEFCGTDELFWLDIQVWVMNPYPDGGDGPIIQFQPDLTPCIKGG
jgi:hypothetical protein